MKKLVNYCCECEECHQCGLNKWVEVDVCDHCGDIFQVYDKKYQKADSEEEFCKGCFVDLFLDDILEDFEV